MENLSSILKESIIKYIDNINKNPELVTSLGKFVAMSRFDWSFMEAIIRGLKEEWLMDKAVLVIVDTWNECISKEDDRCYNITYHKEYDFTSSGVYQVQKPQFKILKFFNIKESLKSIKNDELERRKVNARFAKETKETNGSDSDNTSKPRRLVDIETATHSFIINFPKNLSSRAKTRRLSVFFADLVRNGKYIDAETSPDVFLKRFTGVHTGEKIVWTADYKQLLYLINKLNEAGILSWNNEKPKPRIRQMICIVFMIRDLEYKEIEGKIGKVPVPTIHKIELSNLNTKIDEKDEGLDPIIRRLIFGKDSTQTVSEAVNDIFVEEGE